MKKLRNTFPRNLLTIDPGFNTGICYWNSNYGPEIFAVSEKPCDKDKSKLERIFAMTKAVAHLIESECAGAEYAIIEDVELWGGSLKSLTSAKRGDTFMLAELIGAYSLYLKLYEIKVKLVFPREWRGQLPEAALQNRILNVFPKFDVKQNLHITDAIGIGLGACGQLDTRINLLNGWME